MERTLVKFLGGFSIIPKFLGFLQGLPIFVFLVNPGIDMYRRLPYFSAGSRSRRLNSWHASGCSVPSPGFYSRNPCTVDTYRVKLWRTWDQDPDPQESPGSGSKFVKFWTLQARNQCTVDTQRAKLWRKWGQSGTDPDTKISSAWVWLRTGTAYRQKRKEWTIARASKSYIEPRERPRWTTRPDERADGSRTDESMTSRSGRSPERPYLDHGGLHIK